MPIQDEKAPVRVVIAEDEAIIRLDLKETLEEEKLLVGDRELGAQLLQSLAHVDEPPLQDRLGHGTNSLRARCPLVARIPWRS